MSEQWTPEKVRIVDLEWEQRYKKAATSKGYAVWDWNMITNECQWDGDCESIGYSASELSGDAMSFAELMHPDDVARMDDDVLKIMNAKYPDHTSRQGAWEGTRRLTFRIRQKDGAFLELFDDSKFFFENGKALRAVGFVSRHAFASQF